MTSHELENTENQFVIAKTRLRDFDFAPYAVLLGREFTLSACKAIDRHKKDIKIKSWIDNYVIHLERIMISLLLFCRYTNRSHILPSDFEESDWQEFGEWYREWIVGQHLQPRTKSKHICSSNAIFLSLVANDTIAYKLDLAPLRQSARAKQSGSRKPPIHPKYNNVEKGIDAKNDPFRIQCTRERRIFDWSGCLDLGVEFTRSVVEVFRGLHSSGKNIKRFHKVWLLFSSFLLQSKRTNELSTFFVKLGSSSFTTISENDWEHYIYRWRDYLKDNQEITLITAHLYITTLRTVWSSLVLSEVVPTVLIKGFKNSKKHSTQNRRKSLSQLSNTAYEVIELATNNIWKDLEKYFDPPEKPEALQFIQALSQELPIKELSSLTVQQTVERIYDLNRERLATLRICAENEFNRWYTHWSEGQDALRHATFDSEELVDLLDSPLRTSSERQRNSSRLLFRAAQPNRLGNALSYVLATQNGILTGVRGRYPHLRRANAKSLHEFHAYLHPHPLATIALWTIGQIDTGANSSVVRLIPEKCITDTNRSTHKHILVGTKQSAGGKAIYDELSVSPCDGQSISFVQAIAQYREMSSRYRTLANDSVNKYLLIREAHGEIDVVTEWWARDWFKRFVAQSSPLKGNGILPSMIRPSVLMDIQHRNAGKIAAAQVLADHTNPSTTLTHYTGRAPVILRYTLLIREFQDRFQAVIIASVDGAADKLGLSKEEFRQLFSEAARTGLGVACLNPMAGIQPGTRPGEACTRQDRCWDCRMRWVVATRENISDLVLFNQYLRTAQEGYALDYPERWEHVWLPWLVFTEIALTKLGQGETTMVLAEGKKHALEKAKHFTPLPLT